MSEIDISVDDLETNDPQEIAEIGNQGVDMVDEEAFDEPDEDFSSVTEEGDGDTDEETADEGDETPDAETSEVAPKDTLEKEPTGEEQKVDPVKGTKLDNDPLTAANQQLANARAALQQSEQRSKIFEQVLRNPETLKALITKQTGQTFVPQEEQKEQPAFAVPEKKYTSHEQLKTPEDLYNAIEERDKVLRAEVANALTSELTKMQKVIQGFEAQKRQEMEAFQDRENTIRIASSAKADLEEASKTYSWLNESSQDFNQQLRDLASKEYIATDYDPQTQRFLGRRKFSDIAKNLDAVIKATSASATEAAKTTLVDKTQARPRTGSTAAPQKQGKMSPESFISAQFAAARSGRRRGK